MPSITVKLGNRLQNIRCLRQDGVFQSRRVANEGIEGANAADGSVEVLEQFIRDARRDLGAETERE